MSREAATQAQQESQTSTSHPLSTGILQRKCDCGKGAGVTGKCGGCEGKRLTLQRKAVDGAVGVEEVPPIVHEVLRSPGEPLDSDTREFMESRFEEDFSQVRIHRDGRSAEAAGQVNALAYTVKNDVVFGKGQYKPGTHEGKHLIAHELAHVIQQDGRTGQYLNRYTIAQSSNQLEHEADLAAAKVLSNSGKPQISPLNSSKCLQRQVAGEPEVDLPARDRARPQRQVLSPPSFRRLAREHPEIAQQLQVISRDTFNLVQTYRSARTQRGVSVITASDGFFVNAVTQWITYTEGTIQQDTIDSEHLSEWIQLTQNVLNSLQPLLSRLNDRFAADAINISQQLLLRRVQRLSATELIEAGRRARVRRRREAAAGVETTSSSISEADLFARTSRDVRRYLSRQQAAIEDSPGIAVPQLLDLLVNRLGHNSERFQNFFEYLRSQQPDLFQQIQLEGRTIYDLQRYRGIEGIEQYRIAGYHERTITHIILGECGFDRETGSIDEVTGVGIGFDVVIGLVPGLGQIADARDITCITYRFANYEQERSNTWSWFSLVAALVGLLPGVGDAFKGLGRILQRYARVPGLLGESVLGRVLRFVSDTEPDLIARNAYALYLSVRRQWGHFTRLGITLFSTLLSRVFAGLSLVPRATIALISSVANRMMPRAYEAAGVMFQQILEGLALIGHRLAIAAASRLRDLRSLWAASPFSTGTQRLQHALEVESALARLGEIERQILDTAADSLSAQRLYNEFEETYRFVQRELGDASAVASRSDEILEPVAEASAASLRTGGIRAATRGTESVVREVSDVAPGVRADADAFVPSSARTEATPARSSSSVEDAEAVAERGTRASSEIMEQSGERVGREVMAEADARTLRETEDRAIQDEVPDSFAGRRQDLSDSELEDSVARSSHSDRPRPEGAANEVEYVNRHPELVEGTPPHQHARLSDEHEIVQTPTGCERRSDPIPVSCPVSFEGTDPFSALTHSQQRQISIARTELSGSTHSRIELEVVHDYIRYFISRGATIDEAVEQTRRWANIQADLQRLGISDLPNPRDLTQMREYLGQPGVSVERALADAEASIEIRLSQLPPNATDVDPARARAVRGEELPQIRTPRLADHEGLLEYGASDLSEAVIQRRQLLGDYGGRNYAAIEFVDPNGVRRIFVTRSLPAVIHSEPRLIEALRQAGIDPSKITRLYTERSPCVTGSSCSTYLQAQLSPSARITWSFDFETTVDVGDDMQAALRQLANRSLRLAVRSHRP